MGLFNFHVHSKEELTLIETCVVLCMSVGLNEKTAYKMARQAMERSIADAKKTGEYYFPSNLYDVIYNGASPSDITSKLYLRGVDLAKLKMELNNSKQKSLDEGVLEDDIKNWLNRSAVSRSMRIEWENMKFIVEYAKVHALEPNLSEEEVSKKVAKRLPIYASFNKYTFDIQRHETDGLLPPELINKVQFYIENRFKTDSDFFEKEISVSTSMNALIRKEMGIGKLI